MPYVKCIRSVRCLILPALLLPLSTALAQNPDISGTWVLNESESRTPDDGRTDGIRTYIPASEITISLEGDELTFEYRLPGPGQGRRGSRQFRTTVRKYVVDGKPHTTVTDGDTIRTVTQWKEGKLVINSERVIYMGLRRRVFGGTSEYSLSEDGRKLVHEDEIRNPDSASVRARVVYDRRES
jgi:hypothetical protein